MTLRPPLAVVLVALGLAACGESKAPAPPPAAAPIPAPVAKPAPEPTRPAAEAPDPDKVLGQRVQKAVRDGLGDGGHGVDATAKGGAVTLWGTVESESDRTRAEQLARAIAGVGSVTNELRVVSGS